MRLAALLLGAAGLTSLLLVQTSPSAVHRPDQADQLEGVEIWLRAALIGARR